MPIYIFTPSAFTYQKTCMENAYSPQKIHSSSKNTYYSKITYYSQKYIFLSKFMSPQTIRNYFCQN